ncbi:imelysin family protein [Ravibacter arvi]|uniref:Imelysin family protein n=1 Tax=Ravibacter arvi TaxID=2051041 RepID=A0ABP8M6J7_9BACT
MFRISLFIFSLSLFAACTDRQQALRQEVVEHYAAMVYANYDDAVKGAQALQSAVHTFTDAPSAEKLEAARKAWLNSRPAYLQTEAYRFYDGPIDGEDGLEGYINAWPLDENFIDYVKDAGTGKIIYGGVINSPAEFPRITADLLVRENEVHGEADVKIGFHAIEFLLWGQDHYDDSPGRRPYTDYLTGAQATAPNGERRAAYLKVVTDLLVTHLTEVRDAWEPGSSYRAAFTKKENNQESITHILSGLGKLSKGELAGERMTVALENKDQEDEHSCFSDNTHLDIVYNQVGMQNVYLGTYKRPDGSEVKGPGFKDLVALSDPELAKTIENQFAATLKAAEAIPAPFDQTIVHNPAKVQQVIRELRKQSDEIQNIAGAIGLTLVIPETNE